MKKIFALFTFFSVVATNFLMAQQPAPVKVENGILQGIYENDLTVYKGIPFAAPPVGNLRWKAPQPAAKWDGTRMADKFAPGAVQGINPPSGKSEDCLYLNIWSPAKSSKEQMPVLVWIYGGGFAVVVTAFILLLFSGISLLSIARNLADDGAYGTV